MNLLIIEDEPAAAAQLQALLLQLPLDITVVGVLETVRNAVRWLSDFPPPDLIISDIRLADGNSFQIFDAVPVTVPVIFTTAYDEFMQKAFKAHGIDYLLKPIDPKELEFAFKKYSAFRQHYRRETDDQLRRIVESRDRQAVNYKTRFLVKTGSRLSTIPVDDVLLIHAVDRLVTLHDTTGKKHILEDSLDDLEPVLHPMIFFRLNRSYIAPITSIERVQTYLNGKLQVKLKSWEDTAIFVSREKAKLFKQWLDGMGTH